MMKNCIQNFLASAHEVAVFKAAAQKAYEKCERAAVSGDVRLKKAAWKTFLLVEWSGQLCLDHLPDDMSVDDPVFLETMNTLNWLNRAKPAFRVN